MHGGIESSEALLVFWFLEEVKDRFTPMSEAEWAIERIL